MSPYQDDLKSINNVDKYFKKTEDQQLIFTGDSLELRIPLKFQQYDALTIGDTVTTPALMDMIIDNKYHVGLNILASITIAHSDLGYMTYAGIEYLVLHLKQGDAFMTGYRVIQDPHIVYVLWSEFVTSGKVPYFLQYADMLRLFEHAREHTGSGIGVSRSVFEGIIAHLSRDKDKLSLQYRLTDMKKPFKMVALESVSRAPTSTIARLNGAYFRDEGVTSALRYQVDEQQPFENILRGIPVQRHDETTESI